MNGSNENKWPTIIFFLTTGFFFFGCVWYLWAGNFAPDTPRFTHDAGKIAQADPQKPILLIKDRETIVGNTRVIYRGRHDGSLHVELYILELDPHFAYSHHIDQDKARDGFNLGDQQFRLLAAGRGSIHLVRM